MLMGGLHELTDLKLTCLSVHGVWCQGDVRETDAALPGSAGAGPRQGGGAAQGAARAAPQAAQAAAPADASGAAAPAPAADTADHPLAPPPPGDVTYEGRPLVAVNITVALPAGAADAGAGGCQAEVCGHRVRVRVPGHQSLELALPLGVAAGGGGGAAVLDARAQQLRLRLPFQLYADCLAQASGPVLTRLKTVEFTPCGSRLAGGKLR